MTRILSTLIAMGVAATLQSAPAQAAMDERVHCTAPVTIAFIFEKVESRDPIVAFSLDGRLRGGDYGV